MTGTLHARDGRDGFKGPGQTWEVSPHESNEVQHVHEVDLDFGQVLPSMITVWEN